jgi:hypothetical protein
LLDELHRITPYDPEHLPLEIELIEAFSQSLSSGSSALPHRKKLNDENKNKDRFKDA